MSDDKMSIWHLSGLHYNTHTHTHTHIHIYIIYIYRVAHEMLYHWLCT